MMLPAILDPWAAHALYEGANLVKQIAGSKLWLVSMAPKAKLQQVMMTVAQKVPLQLVAVDGPSGGFADAQQTATALAAAIRNIPGLDLSTPAVVRRMGIGQPQRRRHAATRRRTARHRRSVPGRRRHHSQGRRLVRGAGTHRRRTPPGFAVRRRSGRAGMGDWKPRRAAQRSAGRHGQHAHHHARVAACHGGEQSPPTGCSTPTSPRRNSNAKPKS